MTGLINPGILTNAKSLIRKGAPAVADQTMGFMPTAQTAQPVPLKGTTDAVAGTSQALTATPSSAGGFGEYQDAQGNKFLPGEAGYPAQAQPDGSYQDAQGNKSLPGEAGYPAQPQPDGSYQNAGGTKSLPGEAGYPAQPADSAIANAKPGAINWDTWSKTPQTQAEIDAHNNPFKRIVAATLGVADQAKSLMPGVGTRDWTKWADTSWNVAQPPAKGVLEDPGANEETFDKTKDQLTEPGDPATQALIDQMMREGGLAPQDFDKFYQNAWEHSARDLNSEYAGRGMGNSSDAMRALGHSRSDLAAQQSKDEADYAMKSWENNINRIATAAKLQGGIKSGDVDRWLALQQGSKMAQQSEEGRVRGQFEDTLGAFNSLYPKAAAALEGMSDADAEIAKQIFMSIPAEFQDQANFEAAAHAKAEGGWAAFTKVLMGGV